MSGSKHKAMQDWVASFLKDNYLYFESASAYPNVRALVPNYGEYLRKTDVCGFKYKSYTFAFVGYEQLDIGGTSDVNIHNMEIMDAFNEWLIQQQAEQNFPDFGELCSEYEIVPLQNMANLATVSDDGLAKYMLAARIDYKEE